MRVSEIPEVLSETHSPAAHIAQSHEAGPAPSSLQGKGSAYPFSPQSDWSPEPADCLAVAQNKNQIVHSHAWASNKLQEKEKEKKKVKNPHKTTKNQPKAKHRDTPSLWLVHTS